MRRPPTRISILLAALLASVTACGGDAGEQADAQPESPLMSPRAPEMNQTAPGTFRARFETTAGDFVIEVQREWAPMGADRFYNLVSNGYYDGVRFFRVIEGFMAQFGIHGDPQVSVRWRGARIQDDPVVLSNTRGTISYAMSGANTRTTQVFINFVDNTNLDGMGFAPFGRVVEGMDVVDALYSGYGEGAPRGSGPAQGQIQAQGEEYLAAQFPELDKVVRASIVGG